jgi:type VI secretion system protein ImpK
VDAIYSASAEVLIAATLLGSEQNMPPAETLRQQLLAMLQQMVSRCRQAGIADKDIAEARYAVVAFADERILRSNWPGRVEWMNKPLQLQLFNEFAAGENFFIRMRALLENDRDSKAIQVYYLCLALGFVGAPGAAQHAEALSGRARGRLPYVDGAAALSPHAVPTDHYSATQPRRQLVLALVIGCIVVVGLGIGLLRWSLDASVQHTERDLSAARTAHAQSASER